MDFSHRASILFFSLMVSGCATDRAIEEISKEFEIPEDIEAVVLQAKKAEYRGYYEEAIVKYMDALKQDENDLSARVGLAGVYLRQGGLEDAVLMLTSVITDKACMNLQEGVTVSEPQKAGEGTLTEVVEEQEVQDKLADYCGVAWNGMGVVYDINGDYSSAEKHYQVALEFKPNDAAFYNNYGYSLIMAHRYGKAEEILQRGYDIAPASIRLRNNLAFSQAWAGKYDQALETFSVTLKDPEAFNNIGYIALLRHDYGKAINLFEKAIELKPVFYDKAAHNLKKAERLLGLELAKEKLNQEKDPDKTTETTAEELPDVVRGAASMIPANHQRDEADTNTAAVIPLPET